MIITDQLLQQVAALHCHMFHVAHKLVQLVELLEAAEISLRSPVQVLQPHFGVCHCTVESLPAGVQALRSVMLAEELLSWIDMRTTVTV